MKTDEESSVQSGRVFIEQETDPSEDAFQKCNLPKRMCAAEL